MVLSSKFYWPFCILISSSMVMYHLLTILNVLPKEKLLEFHYMTVIFYIIEYCLHLFKVKLQLKATRNMYVSHFIGHLITLYDFLISCLFYHIIYHYQMMTRGRHIYHNKVVYAHA